MKKILASGVALAALMVAAPAFAADIAQPYPTKAPVVAPVPVFSWTGFYLGANAGYGWGSGNGYAETLGLDPDGWLGGGQVGFNYQLGNNVVIGVEADLQGTGIKDTAYGYESKLDYFGTVRARVGYAFDTVLPYVTGGFAYGKSKINDQVLDWNESSTQTGWTIGAGVEYAFLPNWTVKAEYLYVDLGDDYYNNLGAKAGLDLNVARVGVNYKF
ncbi:outer membrane protein [Ancylobacter oerskovii]|uniref:Outer membrane protein n=1 Tax=Ancylobacter oerskovii TaxID=459519 RepID=A0ABW4Z3Y9_9HYPH|nr:outer membrane protein [Ancylobacter oerskovii]MBS7545807.1 porin family protein [Ancylobacter oerskovii]